MQPTVDTVNIYVNVYNFSDNFVMLSSKTWHTIHRMTIMSYGQCCCRHVAGQRVVSDISVNRSCWSICSLCSESDNSLLCLLIAAIWTSILPHTPNMP